MCSLIRVFAVYQKKVWRLQDLRGGGGGGGGGEGKKQNN